MQPGCRWHHMPTTKEPIGKEVLETLDLLSPNLDDGALSEKLRRDANQNQWKEAHVAHMQSTA